MTLTAGKLYRRAITDHWLAYVLGTATLLATSITEILVPRFVQWALDLVSGGPAPAWFARGTPLASLHALVTFMLGALVVGLAGRFGWRQLLARRTHLTGWELKRRFWRVLRHLPLRVFHDYPLGDLMNRATGDWNASRAIHGFTVVMTLDLIFFTVLSIASMLSIHVGLTLCCLAVFPFLPRRILRLARREHDLHVHAQEKLSELSTTVTQSLSTIRLQRATHSDALWQDSMSAEARAYAERRFQVVRTGWKIFPLGAVPTLIAYAILLFYGVHKIASGELTIGQFVALQSYVLMLQGPLFDMGDCIAEWQRGFASLGRIAEIFSLQGLADLETQKHLAPSLAAGPLIEVKDLTFKYERAAQPALSGVSLRIEPGETLGILGPIGSGKSTLLALLAGLLEAPRGHVYLAGGDAADLSRAWLAEHVTMVPQRAFLFAGTVRGNLELEASFTDEQLWEVLATVKLEADIRAVGGLEAKIGEWGINLSGGQKQRMALARALLRRRDFIYFDDCLSAVDAVTEEEVLNRLRVQLKDSTVVWVAHRLSTLALCDRVFQLESGALTPVRRGADRRGEPAVAAKEPR